MRYLDTPVQKYIFPVYNIIIDGFCQSQIYGGGSQNRQISAIVFVLNFPMFKKYFSNLGRFLLMIAGSIASALLFCNDAFAQNFNIADYPGWCVNGVRNDNGNLTVDLVCCADGGGMEYTGSYTQLTINYASTCTCDFNYECGECTTAGIKACEVKSTLPANATCSNHPLSSQTCTYADNIPPVVNVLADVSGITGSSSGSGIITVNASDNIGIEKVEIYIDGNLVFSDTASPYEYTWPATGVAAGTHTILAKAYDAAGNSGTASLVVNIAAASITSSNASNNVNSTTGVGSSSSGDITPPYIVIVSPENNAKISGATVIKVSASDNVGVSEVIFYINGNYQFSDTASPYEYNWPVSAWEDGDYSIKIEAYDAAGNIGESKISVKVGNSDSVAVSCSYSCAAWGDCTATNIQTCTRLVVTPEGANCTNPLAAMPVKSCTYNQEINCVYSCAKWDDCRSDNKQICLNYSHSPAGADCPNPAPSLIQACTYAASLSDDIKIAAEENIIDEPKDNQDLGNKEDSGPIIKGKKAIACIYDYSSFGACVNNRQSRIILSKRPVDCREEISLPALERDCRAIPNDSLSRSGDVPLPAPEAVTAAGLAAAQESQQLNNYNGRTSGEWQKYYFGEIQCRESEICGGDADPDIDGLSNNDEYRFGTDPNNADTDKDGYVDASEIQNQKNPLVAGLEGNDDSMEIQNPSESNVSDEGIYKVTSVETVGGNKNEKISKLSGKGLPNTYVNIYIYSDPIVMSVKTDKDGNWSYVIDRPLELGNHEVYVAVTSNTGHIIAKSNLFAFAQTAEAAVPLSSPGDTEKRAPSPVKSRMGQGYLLVGMLSLVGIALAVISIGLINKSSKKEPQ